VDPARIFGERVARLTSCQLHAPGTFRTDSGTARRGGTGDGLGRRQRGSFRAASCGRAARHAR
jgi:hypothetical protein